MCRVCFWEAALTTPMSKRLLWEQPFGPQPPSFSTSNIHAPTNNSTSFHPKLPLLPTLASFPLADFLKSPSDCQNTPYIILYKMFHSRAVKSRATSPLLFHSISLFCLISSPPWEFFSSPYIIKSNKFFWAGDFPTEKPICVCPSIMTGKDYFPLCCILFISPPQLIIQ